MPVEACSGMWRSEDMIMVQLHMQREAAHDTVLKLGQLGMVQFQDMNKATSAFQRDFAGEVRRCDDMERKLRFFKDELLKSGMKDAISVGGNVEPETMNTLERKIEERDVELRELNSQFEALMHEKHRTRENLELLSRDLGVPLSESTSGGLSLIAGVIPKDKIPTFERLVYRVTRGNSVLRFDEIREPFYNLATNEAIIKSIFAIVFSAPRLDDKLRKICDVCSATIYPYAEDQEQLTRVRQGLQAQADTLAQTLAKTSLRRDEVLQGVSHVLYEWRRAVITEKGVYNVLNLLQFQGSTVVGCGWCPLSEVENVKNAIRQAEISSGAQVGTIVEVIATKETPPTYFATNKVTESFQGIVDSYGVPRYKEVNPGVFTIVSFPYLFGIMYGDVGHGLILTVFAAFLIFMEKNWEGKPLNEIFAMIFGGRYLLFGMGIFAIYLGLLYNDMFGFSTELFRTGYIWPPVENGPTGVVTPISPNGKIAVSPDHPCPFGIDAAWSETENKLEFYNSVKMKCAVIIGVVQMAIGVVLSLMNYLYFNKMNHVWFRFVPEILFLFCTFGYMALMIVMKWCIRWDIPGDQFHSTNDAPSLLETMTNFFLQPGTVTTPLYAGQAQIQAILLLIAFVMVPVMLGMIPYLENRAYKQRQLKKSLAAHPDSDDESEEEFDFSELMIHQIIQTIEFVLGCVSNTASYLRLWALSLAHAQLSDVFWNFAFMMTVGLDQGSGVFVFIGFAVWISATLGVLLCMESLSAFLHALRLHWVEFQNKFYSADGIAFQPFDVAAIVDQQLM